VRRRYAVAASGVALSLFSACATTATSTDQAVGSSSRHRSSGYQVREASESAESGGLEVALDHGFISQDAAQESVMKRWPDLRRCYQAAGPAMDFAAGPVSLRFVVDTGGRTSDVRVLETRLGNYDVERCLVGAGRKVVFPRPQGGAAATVDYALEFLSTGGIAVVDLPASEIEAEVPGLHAQIKSACDRLGAEEVSATLYLEGSGAVRSAGLSSAGALDADAMACVWDALSHARIPPAEFRGPGLGRVTVALREADLVAARDPVRPLSARRQPRRRRH
jgi:hypothetical protein